MKTETFPFAGYNGTNLPAYLWLPEGEVKAVLQITYGMTEHMGRYEAFAKYLTPMGIAVAGLFRELLGCMKRTGNTCDYGKLPVLLISGQDDPVGDGGKGVQAIYHRMKKNGMEHVTMKLFPGARHDLLHEEKNGAGAARKLIAEWIKL